MTFTLHVEHEVIGGETVLEKFEGVESFNDPPMTTKLHLKFADEEQDDKKLGYGHVVRATSDTNE
jgi:hypothetical protein